MSMLKVYLKTFDTNGVLWDDFIEITKDCDINSIGQFTQALDNNDYDIGIFRNSSINIKMNNQDGRYSTPDILQSYFRYQRNNSIIRVTWQNDDTELRAGWFTCGSRYLSSELTLFEGLLNDDSSMDNTKDLSVNFQVLGYESMLENMLVPFSSLSNGQTISTILYTILNQTPLTNYVTVDSGNIDPSIDVAIDDVSGFENQTVVDALKTILLLANSVLYLDTSNIMYVVPRTESTDLMFTFYGQGSQSGIENIADINNIRTGINKTFNYITWKQTGDYVQNTSSVDRYGTQLNEIDNAYVTNSTNISAILQSILDEFQVPKKQLTVVAPMNNETMFALKLLDKVAVDFPEIPIEPDDGFLSRYESAVYDTDVYADALSNLLVSVDDRWKIMERRCDPKAETLTFVLRAV